MELVSLNSEPIFEEGCSMQLEKEFLVPVVGLEFESFDGAYDFYNVYAKGQGFGVRVSNSWFRSKRRERYRAKLSCSSAGFKRKSEANNPRPETRTGCPAMLIIKLVDGRRWRIVEVELVHNHPVSPEIKRFYKSHKKMQSKPVPVPVREVHTIKLYLMDAATISNDNTHLNLKEGDALGAYNYFCRMKLTNPNFFYLIHLDDEGHLNNLFWADARSRIAYHYFPDTIMIDTTSLTNKYEVPLVSFVGINHHGQPILLGCAILGDDDSPECFAWMFRTWLTCMSGRHPQVIVTDQSKPLQIAVSEVFPQARHCYCFSYIMLRVPEKLGGLNGFEVIKRQLKKVVFGSLTISEFETLWGQMISQHKLRENKWLQVLYEDRQRWAPVYLKDTSFSGMLPVSPFFDGYVHKHTSLKEFLDKYDLALQRKFFKEATQDIESRSLSFELKTKSNFELQLSKVYTKEMFKKCQIEVEGMYSCFNIRQVASNGPILTFVVEGKEEVRQHEVVYKTTQVEVRCICGFFNFKGYLCRHALSVLHYNGVQEIPSQYILPRWDKDYKRKIASSDGDEDSPWQWRDNLFRRGLQVVEEGAQSHQHFEAVMQELDSLMAKFILME